MKTPHQTSKLGHWPFWLLIVAWACAHSPQTLTFEVVVWVGSAKNFSHQQRLAREVAFVLTGQAPSESDVTLVDGAARPFAPPVPADATLKKIELNLQRTVDFLPPALRMERAETGARRHLKTWRAAPPDEPPRQWWT